MKSEQNKGYLLVLLAGILWGSIGFFATKLSDMGMNAGPQAFFRVFFSTLMLALTLLIKGRGTSLFRIGRRGLISCMLVGVVSQAFFNVCYMNAIEQSGMATAAVFLYTSPIYVAVLSRLFFREPLTGNKILAIVINIVGCVLTVTGGDFTDAKISAFGLIMGLLAGLTYALLPVLSRTGAADENPYTAAFYGQLFGSILLFFLVRPYRNIGTALNWKVLLVLIGFGVIPSAMAYIAYYGGIGRMTETSKVPVIASVETVVAAVIGLLAFGQKLGILKILGIALVLCSIAVMNAKRKKEIKNEKQICAEKT
ncbi:MAG: EamA family transporter [Clostridia bacterium]|nr:EamA family transporter [Clostridia bacterium]